MIGKKVYQRDGTIRYYIDGVEVDAEMWLGSFPHKPLGVGKPCTTGVREKLSDALAVHPLDVPEAIADAKRKGVPTEFAADGRPVIRSRAHQKAYIKAYGFHNNDGGYGD